MKNNRMKDALENIARRDVPENANLWPRIAAQLERKSFMMTLRTRPLTAMLIALLILLALSGVAYALGRVFGYIPGIGLVDQSAPIRVLPEPVSQTRDGITITVKDAVLTSDKTVIVFDVENFPLDKIWSHENFVCQASSELRLPDGTLLQRGVGEGTGYKMRLSYAPVPANVNDATLIIPCIDATPGTLPENWELVLHFAPAPPEMTVMPVIEITPSPALASGTDAAVQNPLSITKVIDTGDSYILIVEFHPPAPSQAPDWKAGMVSLKITDANGQEIPYEFPQDIDLPTSYSPKDAVQAMKFSKGFAPPLHITYSNQYSLPSPSQETVEFEFDTGPNPHEGQIWQLNKEIQLAGHTFTLVSVDALTQGYNFNFVSSDKTFDSVDVDIAGYTPTGGAGGGGGGYPDSLANSRWSVELDYNELLKGKLKVVFSNLWIYGETKDWTLEWQP